MSADGRKHAAASGCNFKKWCRVPESLAAAALKQRTWPSVTLVASFMYLYERDAVRVAMCGVHVDAYLAGIPQMMILWMRALTMRALTMRALLTMKARPAHQMWRATMVSVGRRRTTTQSCRSLLRTMATCCKAGGVCGTAALHVLPIHLLTLKLTDTLCRGMHSMLQGVRATGRACGRMAAYRWVN